MNSNNVPELNETQDIPPGIDPRKRDDDGYPLSVSEKCPDCHREGKGSLIYTESILDCLKSTSVTANKKEVLEMINFLLSVFSPTASKKEILEIVHSLLDALPGNSSKEK